MVRGLTISGPRQHEMKRLGTGFRLEPAFHHQTGGGMGGGGVDHDFDVFEPRFVAADDLFEQHGIAFDATDTVLADVHDARHPQTQAGTQARRQFPVVNRDKTGKLGGHGVFETEVAVGQGNALEQVEHAPPDQVKEVPMGRLRAMLQPVDRLPAVPVSAFCTV